MHRAQPHRCQHLVSWPIPSFNINTPFHISFLNFNNSLYIAIVTSAVVQGKGVFSLAAATVGAEGNHAHRTMFAKTHLLVGAYSSISASL